MNNDLWLSQVKNVPEIFLYIVINSMEGYITLTIQKIESRENSNWISRKISISEVESPLLRKIAEEHRVI